MDDEIEVLIMEVDRLEEKLAIAVEALEKARNEGNIYFIYQDCDAALKQIKETK